MMRQLVLFIRVDGGEWLQGCRDRIRWTIDAQPKSRYKIQDIANEPRAGRMGDTTLAVLRGCAVLDRPMEPRRA